MPFLPVLQVDHPLGGRYTSSSSIGEPLTGCSSAWLRALRSGRRGRWFESSHPDFIFAEAELPNSLSLNSDTLPLIFFFVYFVSFVVKEKILTQPYFCYSRSSLFRATRYHCPK